MFNNVMIGIDGLQGGRDAITLAQQLVSDDGKLTLAYVHGGYPVATKGSGLNPLLVLGERDRAQELLDKTADEIEADVSLASIGLSSVGRGLHELAERHGADLLVVGSTRHGLLGRVLISDDTISALNGAPCAVAVAPAAYADRAKPLQKIGVAFNGSPESRQALTVARELATYFGAKLSACDVLVDPAYVYLGGEAAVSPSDDELADRFEAGLLDGVDVHTGYGFPSEELGFYSGSVDLLVAGSRGYGPLGRLMHGSTTAQLTRTARCPLLVLTRDGGAETQADSSDSHEAVINA